jgi:AraC-like DNA-binding protein
MFLTFEDRPSDSPFVERVWRARTIDGGVFHSIAESNLELVITRLPGLTRVTLRGPVTKPSMVDCPANGQWIAIRFRLGTYLPRIPTALLLDHNSLELLVTADARFWFEDAAWEIPTFENAEVFVQRLARHGAIGRDPAVGAAILGDRQALSRRSVQRHFLHATGMTHTRLRQIERARFAVDLLRSGSSILDVVSDAGYFDQAHLTRSLQRLTGQTPMKILRKEAQLSFLYKAIQPPTAMIDHR